MNILSPNRGAGVPKGPKQGLFQHAKKGSESLHRILARDLVLQLSVIKILLREKINCAPDTFLTIKIVILKREAKFKKNPKAKGVNQ